MRPVRLEPAALNIHVPSEKMKETQLHFIVHLMYWLLKITNALITVYNKIIIIAASAEISVWCNLPFLDWWTLTFHPLHLSTKGYSIVFFFIIIHVTVANSGDPNQTSYLVESDLCLHCLS